MHTLEQLYSNSLALLTDLYQLTMAYAYWKSGTAGKEAVFHLSFRENPYHGGFAVGCGLGHVVGVLTRFGFESSDLDYLSSVARQRRRAALRTGFSRILAGLPVRL